MEQEHTSGQHIKGGVDLERVRAVLSPILSAQGVALVDLEWLTERSGWVLRVTIEREGSTEQSGGVTLEDCTAVSRETSAALDTADFIPHHYNLEVSSPGLDRPLRSPAEFTRFVGHLARVKLARPAPDGQKLLRGLLVEASSESVAVMVDGKRIEAPYADVAEANLVFELAPQPKKGARTTTKAARSKR